MQVWNSSGEIMVFLNKIYDSRIDALGITYVLIVYPTRPNLYGLLRISSDSGGLIYCAALEPRDTVSVTNGKEKPQSGCVKSNRPIDIAISFRL